MKKVEEQPRLGVIDAISAGFSIVSRRPWLMGLPVLLDVGLWLGPRLTIRGLLTPLLSSMAAAAAASPEYQAASEVSRQYLELIANRINLLALLANGFLGFPSLVSGQGPDIPALSQAGRTIDISNIAGALGLVAILVFVSLLVGGVYLVLIGQRVRGETPIQHLLLRTGRIWVRLTLLSFSLFVAGLVITIPLGLLLGLLSVVAPGVASIGSFMILVLAAWLLVWLAITLTFAVPAIILDEVGVGNAVWRSMNVVGRNFWPTIGLILLSLFLTRGFSFIWLRLGETPLGLVVSIVGNAYIGSGLVAATLVFYSDRRRRWLEAPLVQQKV